MITPETTVAELGSILARLDVDVSAHYNGLHRVWRVLMESEAAPAIGTGPDLITALNDALGKVGNGRS